MVRFQHASINNEPIYIASLLATDIITQTQAIGVYYDSCYWNFILLVLKECVTNTYKYFNFVCGPLYY